MLVSVEGLEQTIAGYHRLMVTPTLNIHKGLSVRYITMFPNSSQSATTMQRDSMASTECDKSFHVEAMNFAGGENVHKCQQAGYWGWKISFETLLLITLM